MSVSSDDQVKPDKNYFTSEIASKYVNSTINSLLHKEWSLSLLYNSLELQPGHILVDMGCGAGMESKTILDKMNNKIQIIGVDPSQSMLDLLRNEFESNPNVKPVCMDALTFSQSTEYSPYDRIFLRYMIHLLTHEERLMAFEGFYKQLAPKKGKLLIIYGKHASETVPFDERTKDIFRKGEKDLETLFDELKQAGFKNIEEETFTYEYPPNSITAEYWIDTIENRAWITFSEENMNEQQLTDLIDHVRKQYESPNSYKNINNETILKCCAE